MAEIFSDRVLINMNDGAAVAVLHTLIDHDFMQVERRKEKNPPGAHSVLAIIDNHDAKTFLLAFVVGVAMYFCVKQESIYLAFVFYCIVTFLTDIQLPVYWASIAEAVDYGEVKTGKRVSGLEHLVVSCFSRNLVWG